MFVVMRGWFIVDNGVWYWYKNYIPKGDGGQLVEETQEEKESKAIANMLLLWVFSSTSFQCPDCRCTSHYISCLGTLWCTSLA